MSILRRSKRFSIVGLSVCAGCTLKWMVTDNRVLAAVKDKDDENALEPANLKLKLKHVQILFRHGARTPLHLMPGIEQATYPANFLLKPVPHTIFDIQFVNADGRPLGSSRYDAHYEKTQLKGGCTGGLLTNYGQDQMYILGKRLRRDYVEKIKLIDSFDPNLVDLTTTHMRRTKESLRCVLAGFFGVENLRKQEPIIVKSNDSNNEIMVPCPHLCPVFWQINRSAMVHGVDMQEFLEDRALLEKELGAEHYKNIGIDFIAVRDDIVARKTHGLPLPKQITPDIYDMVNRNATKIIYYANCGQHEAERMVATRLSMGRLMKKFLDNIKDTVSGKSKVKMHMYSGHDTTIMPILAMLNLEVNEWPPFGADIIFELYEDADKKHYITVRYLGKPRIVRGCDKELCPLDQFIDTLSPYQIDEKEFNDVCHSNILQEIAKELLDQEEGEVETEESKERSDYAAGL